MEEPGGRGAGGRGGERGVGRRKKRRRGRTGKEPDWREEGLLQRLIDAGLKKNDTGGGCELAGAGVKECWVLREGGAGC